MSDSRSGDAGPALTGATFTGAAFGGFVAGGAAMTLPAQFVVEVMPLIEDEAELRATLYALYAIRRPGAGQRPVRASELVAAPTLVRSLQHCGGAAAARRGLAAASGRGTLLALPLEDDDTLYFVNDDAGRRSLERVRSGAASVPGAPTKPRVEIPQVQPRAVQVYEQEIGLLSPAASEQLVLALDRYPEEWIVDALREAAVNNARSWRYVEAILRRWESEGRDDAKTGAAATGAAGRKRDPYERVVRR